MYEDTIGPGYVVISRSSGRYVMSVHTPLPFPLHTPYTEMHIPQLILHIDADTIA